MLGDARALRRYRDDDEKVLRRILTNLLLSAAEFVPESFYVWVFEQRVRDVGYVPGTKAGVETMTRDEFRIQLSLPIQ